MKRFYTLFVIFIALGSCIPIAEAQVVTIPDSKLKTALKARLGGLGPNIDITQAHLSGLTSLSLDSSTISDLTGLEYITNATTLSLSKNDISDISPLSGLTSLTELNLSENDISDISPLSGLTSLQAFLRLDSNNISDISALSGLTKLMQLHLNSNNISDIGSSLSGLTNLTFLVLDSNNISDISSLSGLTSLTHLWLASNSITSISALSFSSLIELKLAGNPHITDGYLLAALPDATDVDVPFVVLENVPTTLQNSAFTVTIGFSETVRGFAVNDISLTGSATATASLSSGSDGDASYTATITPTSEGDVIIQVPAGAAVDTESLPNLVSKEYTVPVDPTKRTVTISDLPSDVQKEAFDVTITFDKNVTGFNDAANDILLTGAGAAGASVTSLTGSGIDYTATITPADGAQGSLIIQVPEGAAQDERNSNINNTASDEYPVKVDRKPPDVEITDVPTTPQNGVFSVTITFSEDVTGFAAGDIVLSGTASATVSLSGSGMDYTATITPDAGADGNVIIQVLANAAQDSANNGNIASQTYTVPVDLAPPSVEITEVPTPVQTGAFDVTITFSEDVTGFAAGDIVLSGTASATVTGLTGSGMEYTATITPNAGTEGDVIIQVPAAVAQDSVNNENTASQTHTVTVDLTPSIVESDWMPNASLRAAVRTALGLAEDAALVQDGGNEIGMEDLTSLTATSKSIDDLTGLEYATNLTTLNLGANDISDSDLNSLARLTNLTTLNLSGNEIVNFSPLAGLTSLTTLNLHYNGLSESIIVDLSTLEGLTGLTHLTLSLNNIVDISSLSALRSLTTLILSDNDIIDISPLAGLTSLTTLRLKGNPVADDPVALKPLLRLTNLVDVDVTIPIGVSIGVPSAVQGGAFDVTVTFDKSVTDFEQSELVVSGDSGAGITTWAPQTGGTDYTATITPTRTGTAIFNVAAEVAKDAADNLNTVATQQTVTVDMTPPTVSIEVPLDVQGGVFDVTVKFSEAVTGFVQAELVVSGTSGASITTWAPQTGGTNYIATITPTGTGTAIFNVAADVAQDAVDNLNTAATQRTVIVDRTRPTVSIEVPSDVQGGVFDVTVKFDESVTGFIQSELAVSGDSGASITTWTPQTGGRDYIATITPTGTGTAIFNVAADVAQDAVDNLNTAATQQTVTVDRTPPTVSIEGPSDVQNDAFPVTITFNEDVTGFAKDAISLSGTASATVTDLTGSGKEYTATITPAAGAEGDVIIQVPANVAQDTADNGNTASQRYAVPVDLTRPSVEITEVPTDVQNGAFDVTITFSEAVTGFAADDISLSGTASATVTDFTGSGAAYTATITPTTEGDVIIQVPANVAQDTADNGNTASQRPAVPVDLTKPTVISIEVPTDVQNGAFDVTITFSEPVPGFDTNGITLTGTATATVDSVQGDGEEYTIQIIPTTSGTISIQVDAGAVSDEAGNQNAEYKHTPSVPVDTTIPEVSSWELLTEMPSDEFIVSGQFDVRITFSEPVIGLEQQGIILTTNTTADATITDFTPTLENTEATLGENYYDTFLIEIVPLTEGHIEIQVDAGAVQDVAGNRNLPQTSELIAAYPHWMPDKNLRDIVREVLGLQPSVIFAKEALLDLTVLDTAEIVLEAEDPKISSINGLEYATELTELYLNAHEISDIRPIATLTQLTVLSLNDNVIENIWHEDSVDNPFENLIELTELYLDGNEINDISPLEGSTQLTVLSLNGNPIEDLTTLAGLTQLTVLWLTESQVEDFSPLVALTDLIELSLNDNAIADISWLLALTQLKILHLENNETSDVSSLADLVNLEILNLVGNPIDDTTPLIGRVRRIEADEPIASLIADTALDEVLRDIFDLSAEEHITYADMRSLTTFESPDSDISNLTGLEHATALTTLDLRNNAIRDVAPLAGLVNLQTLRLTGNPIQDVSALADLTAAIEADVVVPGVIADAALAAAIRNSLGLPPGTRILATTLRNLTTLDAQDNEITTLTGLEHATALTTLYITSDAITDISSLQGLTHLKTLAINGGEISDITPLQNLTHLTILVLSGGEISDITPLQNLTRLTILVLSDNAILDITPLSGLKSLKVLDLRGNSINSIDALQGMTALTTLNLSANRISSIVSLQGMTGLTTLDLGGNSLNSIAALQGLTGLRTLNLEGNAISEIAALRALTLVRTLNLGGNSINSIDALQGLTGLRTLDLAGNTLSSIDGLQGVTALTTLDLGANALSDIRRLQGLTALKRLYLSSNNISDVAPLSGLLNLELLRLAENPIMDTSPLFPLVTEHKLRDVDIEISQWAPWDVNRDGSVDATDSALITAAMGQTGEAIANLLTDINGDGIVDRADLLLVTEHFSTNNAGAPSSEAILALLGSSTLKSLDRTTLAAELNLLLAENDGSPKYRRAIAMLQSFLVALRPDKTRLLANYPNPFNPETWIPYQLAAAGDVAFVIYDARGAVVRRLAVGHQKAGYYVERNRAAYWDGRNAVGERVASGIYFYELRADNRSLLRKMLILK